MSSKKKLLVSGDSWTESPYNCSIKVTGKETDEEMIPLSIYPCWPDVIAERMDLEVVNLGRIGGSNSHIFNSIYDYISERGHDDIALVACLWSAASRIGLPNLNESFEDDLLRARFFNPTMYYSSIHHKKGWVIQKTQIAPDTYLLELPFVEHDSDNDVPVRIPGTKIIVGPSGVRRHALLWQILTIINRHNVEGLLCDSIRYMHMLQEFLKSKQLPYMFSQGIPLIAQPDCHSVSIDSTRKNDDGTSNIILRVQEKPNTYMPRIMMNTPKFDLIDEDNFVGWPLIENIGGRCMHEHLHRLEKTKHQFRVGRWDDHPNVEGHKLIADKIHEAIQEAYPLL